jgi:hypothetical protein
MAAVKPFKNITVGLLAERARHPIECRLGVRSRSIEAHGDCFALRATLRAMIQHHQGETRCPHFPESISSTSIPC